MKSTIHELLPNNLLRVSKKLFLLCFLLVFIANTNAQESKAKKEAKAKTEKAAKEVKEKAPKLKKDGTPDKRFKDADKNAPKLKKDGTVDKRYKGAKDNNASATGEAKSTAGKAKAAANKAEAKAKKEIKERVSNEKAPKVRDKVTGTYNGKKVYTGPRGGRYYINSNGNKTYISDDK
ncbi:hypothetical protein L1S35_02485 [Flavobacterium sp. AS60]|uniref:hypothetical protein n=1 Tax=Flavobacterium anseongense TaxID=2910677 RepID=UPI001F42DBCB|nr:hypothetical protein [Flavobacterium sp. AS60]MCF6128523.1 hypothetical protein [Flavobacterium sp. AS60]